MSGIIRRYLETPCEKGVFFCVYMADINNAPAGGFQNGGWYWDPSVGQARQYWNGGFGAPGQINNPNQAGYQPAPQSSSPSSSSVNQSSSAMPSSFSGVQDPVSVAQQLLQFQQQASAPAVGSLQASIPDLESRYNDLITSIKGEGTVQSNYAQQAASMDLGRRGLLPQSQEGQTALSNALLPVTQATSAALSQAGIGEQSDINQINQAIAALQTGQTSTALQGALSLYNTQQQMATQLALGSLSNLYKEFGLGGGVINTQTGQTLGGGGGGNGFSLSGNTPTLTVTPTITTQPAASTSTNTSYSLVTPQTIAAAQKALGIQPAQQANNPLSFMPLNQYQLPNSIPLNMNNNNNGNPNTYLGGL